MTTFNRYIELCYENPKLSILEAWKQACLESSKNLHEYNEKMRRLPKYDFTKSLDKSFNFKKITSGSMYIFTDTSYKLKKETKSEI